MAFIASVVFSISFSSFHLRLCTLSVKLTIAPASSKTSITSTWPFSAAACNGVRCSACCVELVIKTVCQSKSEKYASINVSPHYGAKLRNFFAFELLTFMTKISDDCFDTNACACAKC